MHTISHSATIDAPVELCFTYVDDFDNIPKFMFGVRSFKPDGPAEPRLGAKLIAAMQLGPVKFQTGGHISEYETNRLIAVRLERGPITGIARWRFEAVGASTHMEVTVEYQIGRGLTGRALMAIIDTIIEPAIKYTETKLREQIAERQRELSA